MNEQYVTITRDQKPTLVALIRKLPGMLSGRIPDENGIAHGFRARLGYAVISLIAPNFEDLGRGLQGADGEKWAPLSKEYLAYGRRFGDGEQQGLKKSAGLGSHHKHAPGDKKGLLTADQLKLWRRTYADRLAWYIMRMPDEAAASRAAAIAWIVVKKAGAKTKLDVFGNRTVQILVDTGQLRQSIQPGTYQETGVDCHYDKPGGPGGINQVMELDTPYQVIVGTNDRKARYHHNGKGHRRRRLWPELFPEDWWRQIIGTAIGGVVRIGELFHNRGH